MGWSDKDRKDHREEPILFNSSVLVLARKHTLRLFVWAVDRDGSPPVLASPEAFSVD